MSSVDIVREGAYPLWGGVLRQRLPEVLHLAKQAFPLPDWPGCHVYDVTCGSSAGSAILAFYGMGVTANDLGERSAIAARAIYGPHTANRRELESVVLEALGGGEPRLTKGKAADELIDVIHPVAARVWDALYYAADRGSVAPELADYYRYLALRWFMLQKPTMHFLKLPTQDLLQLSLQGDHWARIAAMSKNPMPTILSIAGKVDALIRSLKDARVNAGFEVFQEDCRDVLARASFAKPSITIINPPTNGNIMFLQSNRFLDSLILGEPQNPTKDDQGEDDFWKMLICESLSHVPSGHFALSFVGDGAVGWDEAIEVYSGCGEIVGTTSALTGKNGGKSGCVLLRRR